jgi:hypothetical protein
MSSFNINFRRFSSLIFKSLKFCKTLFDSHLSHRFGSSDANAFRTFDREIPNCFAIRDGVMPPLNDRSVGSGSMASGMPRTVTSRQSTGTPLNAVTHSQVVAR